MKTSFTSGPWNVGTYLNNDALTVEDCRDGEECIVAMVMPSFIGSDMVNHQEANARLIASSPDILSALVELHEYTRTACSGYRNALTQAEDELYLKVDAAINLATKQ